MGELLTKQPLVEALCELRFSPSNKWDLALLELLRTQIKDEFPEYRILQGAVEPVKFEHEIIKAELFPVFQLKRLDESAMVQASFNLLVINQLQPYTNWLDFRDLILKMLSKYIEVFGEARLEKVGLRYVNHIPTPEGRFEIEDFLTVLPIFPSPLNLDLVGFSQLYDFQYPDLKAILRHQTGVVKNPDGKVMLLLDLGFISQELGSIANVPDWLNQAHDCIESAFIASLNPDYYESIK